MARVALHHNLSRPHVDRRLASRVEAIPPLILGILATAVGPGSQRVGAARGLWAQLQVARTKTSVPPEPPLSWTGTPARTICLASPRRGTCRSEGEVSFC